MIERWPDGIDTPDTFLFIGGGIKSECRSTLGCSVIVFYRPSVGFARGFGLVRILIRPLLALTMSLSTKSFDDNGLLGLSEQDILGNVSG